MATGNDTQNIPFTPGVLAAAQLQELIKEGFVARGEFSDPEVGPSAIDLRLGTKAWKLKLGQRPTTRELQKIKDQAEPIELQGGKFEFRNGGIYLVQLDNHLALPGNISGRASGKSSVGRLDVITRLITTDSREYDVVSAAYKGPLHLLLMPQTFSIRVAPGSSLNQLRLFSGSHSASIIARDHLHYYGTPFWYFLQDGSDNECEKGDLPTFNKPTEDPLLFDLTVDLADPKYPYIFRAKKGITDFIDLGEKATIDPTCFFETVEVAQEGRDRSVVLEQGSFYIMKSKERLHIPDAVAVEVVAISERIGDIRIHYAGFVHPGFGIGSQAKRKGTPLIFEVRATDMDTKLYNGSTLARIQLFRMSQKTDRESSAYDDQELKLSKVFTEWPASVP